MAEVLITLGIIGVVAAMTMPTLIGNYQRKSTATRLKHFSSLMQQAGKMRATDESLGNVESMESLTPKSSTDMLKYVNLYIAPYIKTLDVMEKESGVLIKLANGSGAYMEKTSDCGQAITACLYSIYCPDYKYCMNVPEYTSDGNIVTDSKHTFLLWPSGRPATSYIQVGWSRNVLKQQAQTRFTNLNDGTLCTSLIYYDGWEIKADNPCWQ